MKIGSGISAIKCPNCGSNCKIDGNKIHCDYCNTDFVMRDDNLYTIRYEKVVKYIDEADLVRAKNELERVKIENDTDRKRIAMKSKSDARWSILSVIMVILFPILIWFVAEYLPSLIK